MTFRGIIAWLPGIALPAGGVGDFPRRGCGARRRIVWLGRGLDARGFLGGEADTVTARRWAVAILFSLLGAALLIVVAPAMETAPDLAVAWVGMLGIIFLLHFGLMALISCFWECGGHQGNAADALPSGLDE